MTTTPQTKEALNLHVYPSHQKKIGKNQVSLSPSRLIVFPQPGIGGRIKFEWRGYLTNTHYREQIFVKPIDPTANLTSQEMSASHITSYKFIKTRFFVLNEKNDEVLYESKQQHFEVILAHNSSSFLAGPIVPDASGSTLDPDKGDIRGVRVDVPYKGMTLEDNCLLFASIYLGENRMDNFVLGTQADQDAVDNGGFSFWLDRTRLKKHPDKKLVLEYQVATATDSKASCTSEFKLIVPHS